MPEGLDTVIGGSAIDEARADAVFKQGLDYEAQGDRTSAIAAFREAVSHGKKSQHLHRLAYLLDLVGEEDEAVQMYETARESGPPRLQSLINLAILYEDRCEFSKAEYILNQVIESEPNEPRARLFLKDVQASRGMYYDDDADRSSTRHDAILDIPVTDFELSVRARNCLKKMQIRTLRDLVRVGESELNSYKNVGDTTVTEIKQMLASKGLRLGQDTAGGPRLRPEDIEELHSRGITDQILNKPISVLDLSVRARKALQMLGVLSLGELAARTEAELLGVKNFGQTSLDEIKERLVDHELSLKTL
ncbi:MAG: tetratricopeptide repeat protein [Planctomycetota bacterium]|nr:tetratricopeptide repeat protein [Planctomycetota bacterium]MDA1026885.1 tetratricopeptide repeat protein [Planctomycetota bacterium]